MARIAGVNIPQNKVVKTALTYIHGIGDKTANDICNELKIDKDKRTIFQIPTFVVVSKQYLYEEHRREDHNRNKK